MSSGNFSSTRLTHGVIPNAGARSRNRARRRRTVRLSRVWKSRFIAGLRALISAAVAKCCCQPVRHALLVMKATQDVVGPLAAR